jgi:hypothetical protein
MPHLTFPIQSGELQVPVLVGQSGQEMASFIAAGRPIPAPAWTAGVIDTGTSVTSVAADVLRGLGLASFKQTSTHTAHGQASVNLFRVSLSILPVSGTTGTALNQPDLVVMELPSPIPGVQVLIGMDVLLDCRLVVDGPGRQFLLEFGP